MIWAVQMSTVEFHPWNSRRRDVERPDEWRIDLDPMPLCGFATVRRVAHVVHELLDEIGAADALGNSNALQTRGPQHPDRVAERERTVVDEFPKLGVSLCADDHLGSERHDREPASATRQLDDALDGGRRVERIDASVAASAGGISPSGERHGPQAKPN